MSSAKSTGTNPEQKQAAQDIQGRAMMQSADGSGLSIPLQTTGSVAEERIQIVGGSGVHVNDVLCGRSKVSFNHSKYTKMCLPHNIVMQQLSFEPSRFYLSS